MPGQSHRREAAVAGKNGEPPLAPVLRRLLRHTGRIAGTTAGTISLIDAARGHYLKAAEVGASCRLGQRFPLDEGATGRAFDGRRPVVIPDYGRLRGGHLSGADPASRGAAVAVPIWWRGDVIAVTVIFAPTAAGFSARVVDALEVLAQSAAVAIVRPDLPYAWEPGPFSPREAEVLALLRDGLTDREIAARLVLSPKTVEKHVAAILRKTGTGRRTAAVVTALDNGWIPPYR